MPLFLNFPAGTENVYKLYTDTSRVTTYVTYDHPYIWANLNINKKIIKKYK